MTPSRGTKTILLAFALLAGIGLTVLSQTGGTDKKAVTSTPKAPFDAIADGQTPRNVEATRPEQQKNKHDSSDVYSEDSADPSSAALGGQNDKGRMEGFDFARDPLGSAKPKMTLAEIMKADIEAKPKVMAQHKKYLESVMS